MTSSALELLSFAARRFIQFETRFYREEPARRQKISAYFQLLAAAIWRLRDELCRQKVPLETSRDLAKLASVLPEHIELELGVPETERLRQFLEQACDTERIYREFNDAARTHFLAEELEKATILLQALSHGLYLPSQEPPPSTDTGFSDPIL